ncbi:MAG: RusA family crossover junction endodeoxyribonuclease [Pseudomonadota bacterium]
MEARAHDTAITFTVPGDIVPWARTGGGRNAPRFKPKRQRNFTAVLKDFGQKAMGNRSLLDGPCELTIYARYPWPKSWSRKRRAASGGWKTSTPDTDNIAKMVKDALNGVVYTDDARICADHYFKFYTDQAPGLTVTIKPLVPA